MKEIIDLHKLVGKRPSPCVIAATFCRLTDVLRWIPTGLRILLCSKPFQTVGMMSYGIYLWQQFFTARDHALLFGRHIFDRHVAILLFPLLFVIVPLSYFWIEQPAFRYGGALSQRAKRKLVPVGVDPEGAVAA